MIPIFLDPAVVRVAVIGRGELAVRRLAWLWQAGAAPDVWSDTPIESLRASAAARLIERLPLGEDLAGYAAIWVADLSRTEAKAIVTAARAQGVLVNVEDAPALCDFHTPAVLRRRKLTLAAGTGGASPAVARAARERLEAAFPPAWGEALEEIATARTVLRAQGKAAGDLADDARERLAQRGLI